MKATILLAAAAALLGSAAQAQPPAGRTTTICLDVSGRQLPVTCRVRGASRINRTEDICQCNRGGQPVTVDVCPRRVRPPPESAAFERDRLGLVQNGSLVGQTWQGRPICVAVHRGA